jgi:hypothetical protein
MYFQETITYTELQVPASCHQVDVLRTLDVPHTSDGLLVLRDLHLVARVPVEGVDCTVSSSGEHCRPVLRYQHPVNTA